MSVIKRVKEALLFLNPAFSQAADKVFDFFLLKVLANGKLAKDELLEQFKGTSNLPVSQFILNRLLHELLGKGDVAHRTEIKEEGDVEHRKLSGKTYFTLEKTGRELLDQVAKKETVTKQEVSDWIRQFISQDLIDEYDQWQNKIVDRFIELIRSAMDKSFYRFPEKINGSAFVNSDWGISGINPALENMLTNILIKNVEEKYNDKVIRELYNLCLFWNTFRRVFLTQKESRDFADKLLQETKVLLDTNTLIASECHFHPINQITVEHLNFLKACGIKLCCSEETIKELEHFFDNIGKAQNVLKYYPDMAASVGRKTSPIIEAFFAEGWFDWNTYRREFIKEVAQKYHIIRNKDLVEMGIDLDKLRKQSEAILKDVQEMMFKGLKNAKHDSYMISLIRMMRNINIVEEWYKYVDWFVTADKILVDMEKNVGEKQAPTSLYVSRIPYYFRSQAIAYAIQQTDQRHLEKVYESLVNASWMLVDTESPALKKELASLKKVVDLEDAQNEVWSYVKKLLWEEE